MRCLILLIVLFVAVFASAQAPVAPVGIFENHADVGTVLHPGASVYDESTKSYKLTGAGDNIWSTADGFQFAWKRVSGDITLSADIAFAGTGGIPHRKAVLMVRQTLDADSPYADAVLHGDGMTALQSRDEKGGITYQVQAGENGPKRLSLRKVGKYYYLYIAKQGEELHLAGASMRVTLTEPFYVGIGVCSHNKDASETAVFSNVEFTNKTFNLYSTLETITVGSAAVERHVVYIAPGRFEAPNWTHDGKWLLFNGNGRLQRISPEAKNDAKPELVDTGFATRLNNDHGISPDGTQLAISDQTQGNRRSTIYVLPLAGGTPRQITDGEMSDYWHAWSPDGKTLGYTGLHNGNWDIYSIPLAGGPVKRLTTADATDDGPEYSPDGKYIYFNSARTGLMQIWRMKPDGSEQEQLFDDNYNNWFPHFSPDGTRFVFVSFEHEVVGHPENRDVTLRMMNLADKKITVLARLFGGQGTINVPSWSPDGKRIAFVSYELMP